MKKGNGNRRLNGMRSMLGRFLERERIKGEPSVSQDNGTNTWFGTHQGELRLIRFTRTEGKMIPVHLCNQYSNPDETKCDISCILINEKGNWQQNIRAPNLHNCTNSGYKLKAIDEDLVSWITRWNAAIIHGICLTECFLYSKWLVL